MRLAGPMESYFMVYPAKLFKLFYFWLGSYFFVSTTWITNSISNSFERYDNFNLSSQLLVIIFLHFYNIKPSTSIFGPVLYESFELESKLVSSRIKCRNENDQCIMAFGDSDNQPGLFTWIQWHEDIPVNL